MAISHCLNCRKMIEEGLSYTKGTDGRLYFSGLASPADYCSTRCARTHAATSRQNDYDNRDQMNIFEVEGV